MWFPNHDGWGVEGSAFFLGRRTTTFSANSSGFPSLARPIKSGADGTETVQNVAFTGNDLAGQVSVDYSSQLWGADLNALKKLFCGPRYHVDFLFGYRYLSLEESIVIRENLLSGASTASPSRILIEDRFATKNTFNGGQIGFEAECRFLSRWFAAGQFKVALGNVHQTLDISGSMSTGLVGGPLVTTPRGILASPTNIGRYERDKFAVVPEANLKVGMDITDQLRIFVGYNFLYVSNVVRPGDAIDRAVGAGRPAVIFKGSDFWAQGFNAGLDYHW
jgi:hypothetical protein